MANESRRVEVIRQFWHQGKALGIGSVIDLDLSTAIELRSANKIKWVQADTKAKVVSELKPPKDGSLPADKVS